MCSEGPVCDAKGCQYEVLEERLQIALGALADLGSNTDMTREQMKHKASRLYRELRDAR